MIFLLLCCLQDADEAVKKLREALAQPDENVRVEGVREALKVRHDRVIRAVGPALREGSEKLRVATALALGDADHPVAAEVLIAVIAPNLGETVMLAAIASSLGKLGFESSAPALHDLLKKLGDLEVRRAGVEIIHALGEIGSAGSVDLLLDLLARIEGRHPWEETSHLVGAARSALYRIAGEKYQGRLRWEDWWKANRARLVENASRVYWLRSTYSRVTLGPGDKVPADAIFVQPRLWDRPAPKKKP